MHGIESSDTAIAGLAAAVRDRLLVTDLQSLPVTYQALSEALGLSDTGRIRRLGMALEFLMEQDAKADRPLLAACVISRRAGGLPAPGFFAKARALGRAPEDEQAVWFRQEQERALAWLADARRLAAYRLARYRFRIHGVERSLTLDAPDAGVAALLADAGVESAAFLTAWNPGSRLLPDPVNLAAGQALDAELAALGYPVCTGVALDPAGVWPAEPGRLVLGIGCAEAVALGCRYGQRALLWVDAEGCAHLRDCCVPSYDP